MRDRLDVRRHGLFPVDRPRLADAVQTLVGPHPGEDEVPPRRAHHIHLDVANLHRSLPLSNLYRTGIGWGTVQVGCWRAAMRTGRWFVLGMTLVALAAFGVQPSPAAMTGMSDEMKTAITHAGFAEKYDTMKEVS